MAGNKKKNKEKDIISALKVARKLSREAEFEAHGKSILRPTIYVNKKKYNRARWKMSSIF